MNINTSKFFLECTKCGARFVETDNICPICGGILNVIYTTNVLRPKNINSIWRYQDRLPIVNENIVSLGEGLTPLLKAENLGRLLRVNNLYIKDETRNPTGSFIDRGISVEITKIRKKTKNIICASLGDTGASISAYASKAGISVTVFVPRNVNIGKLYQMLLCNAEVRIARSYDEALSIVHSRHLKDIIFSEASPYYLEGIKTIAFEIAEQLEWNVPDFVVVPMGTGGLITMMWKGFKELKKCGLIDDLPRLIGVQVKGADPITKIYSGWKKDYIKYFKDTLATDLQISKPILGELAVSSIRESNGKAISVENKKIPQFIKTLAGTEGIISEPAGIIPIIAVKELRDQGDILQNEIVVVVVTGSGLKTLDVLQKLIPIEQIGKKIASLSSGAVMRPLGETKIRILKLLEGEPMHGYGIRKKLREKFNMLLSMSTIYQHLYELMDLGLVSRLHGETGKKRKIYYVLTDRGKEIVKSFGSTINQVGGS